MIENEQPTTRRSSGLGLSFVVGIMTAVFVFLLLTSVIPAAEWGPQIRFALTTATVMGVVAAIIARWLIRRRPRYRAFVLALPLALTLALYLSFFLV